jgi:hypothetical protein
MPKVVQQNVTRGSAYLSSSDLRKRSKADRYADRFAIEDFVACFGAMIGDQYGLVVMCRRSWATSCHSKEPALRWIRLIRWKSSNFIQKIKSHKILGFVEKIGLVHSCHNVASKPPPKELLSLSSSSPLRASAKNGGSRRFLDL